MEAKVLAKKNRQRCQFDDFRPKPRKTRETVGFDEIAATYAVISFRFSWPRSNLFESLLDRWRYSQCERGAADGCWPKRKKEKNNPAIMVTT